MGCLWSAFGVTFTCPRESKRHTGFWGRGPVTIAASNYTDAPLTMVIAQK